MSTGEIILYQNQEGNIRIDVRLEDETVWLSQAQISDLFQKSKATISEHIKNVFEEGELEQGATVRNFRTVRLDSILQHNGRELLTHAGKISHEAAVEKSNEEFEKYKLAQKIMEKEQSLKEIEADIKRIKSNE